MLAHVHAQLVYVQLVQYTVSGQPLFLDWLDVHAPSSPKHCFTLVQRNRLQQLVTVHTLRALSLEERVTCE